MSTVSTPTASSLDEAKMETPAKGGGSGSGESPTSAGAAGGAVGGDGTTDDGSASTPAGGNKAKKSAIESSAAVPLALPPPTTDPTPQFLSPLRDESSAYAVVAKCCLQWTSYAGKGSGVAVEDNNCVSEQSVFHDASYARIVSESFKSLIECLQNHKDRRCRILACRTLAIVARSAYARLRHPYQVFSQRETVLRGLEDEVGSEVATALVTACLEDEDEGVSAAALEAVGTLVLSTTSAPGTIAEDELWREIQAMAYCRSPPYAPTLGRVSGEDPAAPLYELQVRVHENVLSPRLLQLVDRIFHFSSTVAVHVTLPCLTACLIHQVKTAPSLLFRMDLPTYAKRWVDVDAIGLVDAVVASLLLPMQQQGMEGGSARTAALCSLRLAQCCPGRSWVPEVARWATIILKEEASGAAVGSLQESKLSALAALIVALRAMPIRDRTANLIWMIDEVAALPSTTMAPHGVVSPGVLIEYQGFRSYRRPARIGFWTEMALSFFMDGPDTSAAASANANANAPGTGGSTAPASAGGGGIRHECLAKFFTSPSFVAVIGEKAAVPGPLSTRDEVLLAFTQVALDAGRRFRVGGDGSMLSTDPNAPEVDQWLKLAWVVLSTFVWCVQTGPKPVFLSEDLTLVNAGLVGYSRLLQEYIHTVGLLLPVSSVAMKLTPNACPPHLLWDQMAESAAFLARFEAVDLGELEKTSKLMEEIVAREKKQGIPSHHMRLFILSLAADHWVQGRVTAIRKQFESSASGGAGGNNAGNNSNSGLSLGVQSGREIVLALSPKRLLAKIFEAHVPPVDADGKRRRDPLKRLALETVRVCVACIENIALTACDWRRRFGSGQEPKHLVSVSVAVLQGKADDTPADDNMRSVMGPLCEAAVNRIQAFYESEGSGGMDPTFPVSELVTQPVKPKIKPLVSSTKPPVLGRDDYQRGYLMQLIRQVVSSRTEQCIRSFPPADSLFLPSRPRNWFRLSVPPVPESKDSRCSGGSTGLHHLDALASWNRTATVASACSDAASLTVAYCPARMCRYDNEDEYRLSVVVRVFNCTAVEFPEGLRLELGLLHEPTEEDEQQQRCNDDHDREEDRTTSADVVESLGGVRSQLDEEIAGKSPLLSSAVVYRQELKAGEYVTWELALRHMPAAHGVALQPTVVYRNVEEESDETGVKWVGEKAAGSGDASTTTGSAESKSGEDDFQVTTTTEGGQKDGQENKNYENVRLPGERLRLSPMIVLLPCPLVFFRDGWGDVDSFRFFWFRMQIQLPPICVAESSSSFDDDNADPIASKIAAAARLTWDGEAIPGGYATRLWAFSSVTGQRVLVVLAETEGDAPAGGGGAGGRQLALHFRGDDKHLLYSLAGTKAARSAVAAALYPGLVPVD